ncbi:MAG: glycerophosphodiester phosphodiesterase [Bacteroidaceae bacterium]|nr:glycerophosphodiester phosphodiesterase [Bacteroidaceae bacterium]
MKNIFFTALMLMLLVSCGVGKQSRMVAHRGYWQTEGSHENSISSLKNAIALGVYGSECDVRQTADGVLVLFHNAKLDDGRVVSDMKYAELADYRLPNGERIPTFEEALVAMGDAPRKFKLVIEVKDADVSKIVAMVERYNLEKKVEYIAFGRSHCMDLIAMNKGLRVSYLAGNEKSAWTPKKLKEKGFYGLDYSAGLLKSRPEWIKEAHDLGLDVNVWTVNDSVDIDRFFKQGVDKVTTDIPAVYKKKR